MKSKKSIMVMAALAAALVVAVAAACWFAGGQRGRSDLPAADSPIADASLLVRHPYWAYYRGDDVWSQRERLAAFDVVVAPSADAKSVKWLEKRGCSVVAGELRFGGVLPSGRGAKSVARAGDYVIWTGCDLSDLKNPILVQECRKTLDELRAFAAEHSELKVLVFSPNLAEENWQVFRQMMAGMRFMPSAGPADAMEIYEYVCRTAGKVPRPAGEK